MKEYIDRRAAIEAAYQGLKRPSNTEEWKRICEQLQMVPTADVTPVRHGRWVDKHLDNFRKWESTCSVCGWSGVSNYDSYVDIFDFEFCPHCGARMDGDPE